MKFKSVIGSILFIMMASLFAFVIFIQTKSFGGLVTKIVSDLSQKKLQTDVQIKNFTLSIFPPGIELNKVQIQKKISEKSSFEAELGKVGIYFSLIEVEEKKLTLGEIRIVDSNINYTFEKSDEAVNEISPEIIENIFNISEDAPVGIDTITFENARVYINHEIMEAKRFKIFKKDDSFVTRFHLANILVDPETSFRLDEVWGDAEISRNSVNLYRLKAQHDVHSVLLKGSISEYYKLLNSTMVLNGEGHFHLKSLSQEVTLPEMVKINEGYARLNFNLNIEKKKINGSSDVIIDGLRSSVAFADKIQGYLTFNDKSVLLEKLSIGYKDEKANLLKTVPVYHFQDQAFLSTPMRVSVENVSLNNSLRILGPSLKPLKGLLNGNLSITHKKGDFYFQPDDHFKVKNLGLVVGTKEKPFTVLMVKEADVTNGQFAVINNEFQMSSSVELARSKFDIVGFVNKNRVQFNAVDARVNLEDFGNISNLDIKGEGEIDVVVSGPLSNTVIELSGLTKNFEILGYRLGETEKSIAIELANSEVVLKKVEAKSGKTQLTGIGSINYKTSDIAIGISTTETNASDISYILFPIMNNLSFLPEDLDYKAKVEVDIFGKTSLQDLKLRSKVHFSDLSAYGEFLNSGSFDISLIDRNLMFKNIRAKKGKAAILGDFLIGLKNKAISLDLKWDNLELASFNLGKKLAHNLNSKMSGILKGEGTTDAYLFNLALKGTDTKSHNYKFADSSILMDISKNRVSGSVNLLGRTIVSDFNMSLKKGLASDIKFEMNSDDLKPLLVAVFGQHLETEDFVGKLRFNGKTTFNDGFSNLSLSGTLNHFLISHAQFNVNYASNEPDFLVEDSVIKKWNLKIQEPDLHISTKGSGTFGKKVSIVQEMHFNSKILEILVAPILSAEGFVTNIMHIDGNGTDIDFSFSSKSPKLNLSLDQVPVPINDLKYDLEFARDRLTVREISSALDNGSISLKGDIYFSGQHPDVNLKYVLNRAEIPILTKSLVNVSGEGIILGNRMPYSIGGDILFNKAQIVNELNEFSSKSSSFSQVRFLPKNQESVFSKLFTLNINLKAENPIRITNSLMDVALQGEMRVFGSPARPRGEGRLFSPVNSSRIFFKNNEYAITGADINFSPKKSISNPDFDIQALTLISSYKIYPKAYGDLERFNFDLTSDPPLPRNSILSLIAFGYTDEIQSTLESKDQQNLTQVGVGSFVFDRFKISDILNKQFGLQVNLGTVIEQSGTDSLLSGRSQDGGFGQGGGSLGRTRSATKIELKKRLDEALTLSVSSTMGGSIGQRQSMNLTYGLTRKIQLEGVYELRTNEEGQEDVIDNSIGGDLKFRWTFR